MEYEVAFGHNVQTWTGEKRKDKVLCLDIMSKRGWQKGSKKCYEKYEDFIGIEETEDKGNKR